MGYWLCRVASYGLRKGYGLWVVQGLWAMGCAGARLWVVQGC